MYWITLRQEKVSLLRINIIIQRITRGKEGSGPGPCMPRQGLLFPFHNILTHLSFFFPSLKWKSIHQGPRWCLNSHFYNNKKINYFFQIHLDEVRGCPKWKHAIFDGSTFHCVFFLFSYSAFIIFARCSVWMCPLGLINIQRMQ